MDPMAAAQRYFATRNRRDPEALVAAFAPGGTYSDPATGGELSGLAIGAYAGGLFAAFPDLQFELVSAAAAGEDAVAAEWVMRGTNSQPFGYNPPTGRTIALPGAGMITVADGAVRSVRGYFDMSAFTAQFGLHAMLAPSIIHPVAEVPTEAATKDMGAYIPALWEHPTLCIEIFGLQYLSPAGQKMYAEAGIQMEVVQSMQTARAEGLLGHRFLHAPDETVIIQYWRSYEDLDRWARTQPHVRWWRWLNEHNGTDLGFYHEIYQAKAAEAIYTAYARPIGAARIASLQPIPHGKGHSRDRQARFAEVAQSAD